MIEEKYLIYYREFPHAIMLFDLYLKYKSLKKDNKVLEKQNKRILNIISNGNGIKNRYKRMIRNISNTTSITKDKNILIVGLHLKYEALVKGLVRSCLNHNIGIYFDSKYNEDIEHKVINIELLLPIYNVKSALFKNICYTDIDEVLDDYDLMSALEKSVISEINYYEKILSEKKICTVFGRTDQASRNQILCYASKKLNIPFVVVPHGHGLRPGKSTETSNDKADYYLLWSEQSKQNYLTKGTKEQRLVNFGYPKYDRRYLNVKNFYSTASKTKKITFFETPNKRDYIVKNVRFIDTVYEKLLELQSKGFEIAVRPHPHQRNDGELIKLCENNNFSFKIGNIVEDFLTSQYCIATITSSLFEASIISGNAIQLVLPYDYIPVSNAYQVEVEELIEFVINKESEATLEKSNERKQNQHLLIDDFSQKFDQYLPKLTERVDLNS